MIKAKGTIGNDTFTVIWSKKDGFLVNGKTDSFIEYNIRFEMEKRHSIGGVFFPEKNDVKNVLNVLQYYTFDKLLELENDENIEPMESVEGRIY